MQFNLRTLIQSNPKVFTMQAVLLAIFLAALDQTIVGTALPKIVQEFNGLDKISWVFTAYMLTSTVSVPIYGKLSDIYGRKFFYISGIVIFLLGSILCGAAQNMIQLILFRGLQGIGGGAIFVNSFAIIADLFPPAQRGKWQGIIGGSFGLASVIGPLVGGWLTDNASWRWVFYVNIPVGILAASIIFLTVPHIGSKAKDRAIDYFGVLTLTVSLVTMLLGFVWGGNQYPWNSWQIISLFVVAVLSLFAFLFIENRTKEPILPLSLFKNRTFTISSIIIFLSGFGMFGALTYIPLFAQDVISYSATSSGLILTPMMLGWVVASTVSGQIVSRTGKYKILAILGMEILVLGMFLLSKMTASTTKFDLIRDMILAGIGMGTGFPIFILAVQNAFSHNKLGVVTATTQLFRSIGGTVGVAIMGSVLNNILTSKIKDINRDPFVQTIQKLQPNSQFNNFNVNTVQSLLSAQGKEHVQQIVSKVPTVYQSTFVDQYNHLITTLANALAESIVDVFVLGTLLLCLALILSFFFPETTLRTSHHEPVAESVENEMNDEFSQEEAKNEPQKPIFTGKKR